MPTTHRIAVGARSPLVAAALATALGDDPRWQVTIGDAIDCGEPPDLLLAAVPDAAAAAALLDRTAGRVLLIGDGLGALAARAQAERRPLGVLSAAAGAEQLRAACAALLAGLCVHDGAAADGAFAEPPGEPLTPRELEVFELVAKGYSNRDIAGVLGISTHTAKFHVGQILAKTGATTRAAAVGIGLKLGLIGV